MPIYFYFQWVNDWTFLSGNSLFILLLLKGGGDLKKQVALHPLPVKPH